MKVYGTVVGVSGSIAEVEFFDQFPKRYEVLMAENDHPVTLEVISSASEKTMYCLVLTPDAHLRRGQKVHTTGHPLLIPVGSAVLGRAFDIFSSPHDDQGELPAEPRRPMFSQTQGNLQTIVTPKKIIETGIKAIDFFTPLLQGGKAALVGGAGVGKTVVLTQLARRLVMDPKRNSDGVAVFSAVGERSREALELHNDLTESGVLERTSLILGQMGESPAIRFRTAYAGAAIAEYFRDEVGTDVLYYMDNLYRFAQAGHELATITNTIPSEDGYQATLTSEMAALNERLHSTKKASITSFMALFVPADDFTDAGVRAAFPFLDTVIFLSREIFQQGRYPAIDFLASTSAALNQSVAGTRHYLAYIQAKQVLERAADLERIVSLVGENELSVSNQKIYRRSKLIASYMTQDLYIAQAATGNPDVSVSRQKTVQTVSAILRGDFDSVDPEKLQYASEDTVARLYSEARKPTRSGSVQPSTAPKNVPAPA